VSARLRVGYLGPEGTFTHEALAASGFGGDDAEPVALPTVYDTVMAVHDGIVERALVPIENSLEGSVNATLDALAVETDDVAIVGEVVHPMANAQCARFIRSRLPNAAVVPANSTADAVRLVSERDEPWAALGNRLSAEIYGCEVLRAGIEDVADNETRFAWLARSGEPPSSHGPWKTSLVFWGVGADAPGWLVRCLSEFAFRGVNMTKIESRPRKQGLGRYMFFVDVEGRDTDEAVAEAVEALRGHTDECRVLGSYPAA
jgi:prephenate dehydratase